MAYPTEISRCAGGFPPLGYNRSELFFLSMLQTDVRSILAIAMITISRLGVFECKIAAANFRGLLGANRTEGTLYQQEFDGSTGLTDSGSFLFPGAIIVL